MNAVPEFRPARFLAHPDVQTVCGALGRSRPVAATRSWIEFPDGDRLALHVSAPRDAPLDLPLAVLIHGLGGSHRSPYMERIAVKLMDRGHRVVRVDLRGCGDGWNTAQKPAHAGCSDDMRSVLQWLDARYPEATVGLAGFSLGGNVVLKLAAEWAHEPPPRVRLIVAVAPPIDLPRCSLALSRLRSRFYESHFLRRLRRQMSRRVRHFPDLAPYAQRPWPRKLREFDDRITAPLAGFPEAETYYRTASAGPHLSEIRVPTRILAAADDPLVPFEIFQSIPAESSVQLHMAQGGGHLGFLAKRRPGGDPDRWWMDWRVCEWFLESVGAMATASACARESA